MRKKKEPRRTGIRFGSRGKGYFRMKHITKAVGTSSFVACAALWIGLAFLPAERPALADGAGEPETVFFSLAPSSEGQNAPAPPSRPWRPEVDQGDAEILAKLLWSSPLTNEDDKRKLCWLVFNRVDDERYGLFGSTVDTVVIRREFTFYDRKAHISETNLRIARDELARWAASLMGIPVERPLPPEYVYASFSGHTVQFYEQIGGNAWNGS